MLERVMEVTVGALTKFVERGRFATQFQMSRSMRLFDRVPFHLSKQLLRS